MIVYKSKPNNWIYIGNSLMILGTIMMVFSFGPYIYDNIRYFYNKGLHRSYKLEGKLVTKDTSPKNSFFASLLPKDINIEPVNRDFSIVIEKINLNAPIVENVPMNDEKAYLEALKSGIAQASVSDYPSSAPGNTYLFAHSSLSFNMYGKYSRAFNLLDKLSIGDKIHVFYNNTDYTYKVVNTEMYDGWDTRPIERRVVSPLLTLQSCYPPGTTLNRIVVTSELQDVR